MNFNSDILTKLSPEKEFRRRMWTINMVTLALPPLTGIFMLSFVGVFPFPQVFYPFTDYALIVVLSAATLGFFLTKRFLSDVVTLANDPARHLNTRKRLRLLPLFYFSLLFLYFAVGLVSTLYSLSTLHGYNYPPQKYVTSFLGVIPGGLITALPIFFYLTDTLGRYLAPKGIQESVAPIRLKLIVLGLFVPVLIDTLLLMYFYDRTGYLSTETIGIWFFLVLIAAAGTLMAWSSFRQSMSPFRNALVHDEHDHSNVSIVPQSLDELGLLSQQWRELWLRAMRYEQQLSEQNTLLKNGIVKSNQELESEKELFGKMLKNTSAFLLVLDTQGIIFRYNPAFEEATGHHFPDHLHKPVWEWLIPKDGTQKARNAFFQIINSRTDSKYEDYVLKSNGDKLLVTWNNSCIMDAHNTVQFLVAVGIDISKRLTMQKELEEAKETAEQSSKAKSEFLSRMSHELRTPMNAILGFGQLLQMDNNNLSETQIHHVEEVMQGAEHLLELINEVLDLTRIEEGRFEVQLEPTDISDIITESVSMLFPLANKNDIELINMLPSGTSYIVQADRLRIKQVFINLLSNAIKYNKPKGQVIIKHSRPDEHTLRIAVSDSSGGIEPSLVNKLFTPFERLNHQNNHTIEGTGIGLALSKRLVELMHGQIGLENRPGTGCTFYFDLPFVAQSSQPPPSNGTNQNQHKSKQRPTKRYKVLYVEDNPPNLRLVSSALEIRSDIQLISAHTGTLGLDMAMIHIPDLILLDINLPGMNGIDILAELRHNGQTKHIPVIAITANAMTRDIEHGKQIGFNEYLIKPLNIKLFHDVLLDYLPEETTDSIE
ncbi:MAG: ATP-binding protein [Gammaproteobacteria bacterium]|nr:ATP-binding protein [Gammaproteobacteria bacterium]MDH5652894.1 ATP-binding protein [Gammaproteobacteria bacterium]